MPKTYGRPPPPRWRIVAELRKPDGSVRTEDLGVHAAYTSDKARAHAIAMHAGRMGWRGTRRGANTGKWVFRRYLVKDDNS